MEERALERAPERAATPTQVTEKERFYKFVYKLAYICAFDKGPDTVTSFGILYDDQTDKIVYAFGANQINNDEGQRIGKYILRVLAVVSKSSQLDQRGQATCRKAIFKGVLLWNQRRIEVYLKTVASHVKECLEYVEKNQEGM